MSRHVQRRSGPAGSGDAAGVSMTMEPGKGQPLPGRGGRSAVRPGRPARAWPPSSRTGSTAHARTVLLLPRAAVAPAVRADPPRSGTSLCRWPRPHRSSSRPRQRRLRRRHRHRWSRRSRVTGPWSRRIRRSIRRRDRARRRAPSRPPRPLRSPRRRAPPSRQSGDDRRCSRCVAPGPEWTTKRPGDDRDGSPRGSNVAARSQRGRQDEE
jgi:hypothetical protein